MKKLIGRLLPAALLLVVNYAHAQGEEGFSGRVAFGYLATSGNTDNENMSGSFDLGWHYAPWHHSLKGAAVRASSGGIDTAEAYSLDWQTDYDFNDTTYAFGLFAWNEDKFSGYDQQVRQAVGYGKRLINTDAHKLNGEIGGGARQADLRDGTSQDEAM